MNFQTVKEKVASIAAKIVRTAITFIVIICIAVVRIIVAAIFLFYAGSILSLSIIFTGTRRTSELLLQLSEAFNKYKI